MLFNKRMPQEIQKIYAQDSMAGIKYGVFNAFFISFVAIIMRKLGASDFTMGIISIAPVAGALMVPLWLNLAISMEKFKFIGIMKITARGILLFSLISKNTILFAIIFFLHNILEQGSSSTYVSIMNHIYPVKYRGYAMGMVRIESALAAATLSFVAGKLFDKYDYRILFFIGIIFGVWSAYTFYRIKFIATPTEWQQKKKRFELRNLLKIMRNDKLVSQYFLIFFLLGSGNLINTALYPMYLVDVLHISNTKVGFAFSLNFLALITGFYIWGKNIDKKNPLWVRIIIMFILSLIPMFYFLMGYAGKYYIVLLALVYIASGLSYSGGDLSRVNFITRAVDKRMIEKYWTIDFFLLGIRGLLMPYVGIILKNIFGFHFVFIISFLMIIIAAVLMILYYKNNIQELSNRGIV